MEEDADIDEDVAEVLEGTGEEFVCPIDRLRPVISSRLNVPLRLYPAAARWGSRSNPRECENISTIIQS